MLDTSSHRSRLARRIAIVAVATTAIASCASDDNSTSDGSDSTATEVTATTPETTEASAATSETTEATAATPETTEAAIGEVAPTDVDTDMSADDQALTAAAISDGLDRIVGVLPPLAPPALYVGVWDPNRGSYRLAQGEAAPGQPASLDDHFRIGSTTKTFTATVVLELVDEGALALDDTIGMLLPDLASDNPEIADISVESLLSMTSGIQDYLNVPDSVVAEVAADPSRVFAAEELIDAALELELLPEGTSGYSTTNNIILQLIAESIEQRPLPDSIDARLLEPLGMAESSLPIEDATLPEPYAAGNFNPFCLRELAADGAVGVDRDTDPTDWSISYAQGGGGMTSTLADLGLWADSNSGNSFLSPELQAARLVADSEFDPDGPAAYGLGIFQLGESWYGHSGEAIGWQSLVVHNPDTGVSLAFAANVCAGMDFVFWAILNELYPDAALDELLTSQDF